jgi:RNA recognition motif-containing protein
MSSKEIVLIRKATSEMSGQCYIRFGDEVNMDNVVENFNGINLKGSKLSMKVNKLQFYCLLLYCFIFFGRKIQATTRSCKIN